MLARVVAPLLVHRADVRRERVGAPEGARAEVADVVAPLLVHRHDVCGEVAGLAEGGGAVRAAGLLVAAVNTTASK